MFLFSSSPLSSENDIWKFQNTDWMKLIFSSWQFLEFRYVKFIRIVIKSLWKFNKKIENGIFYKKLEWRVKGKIYVSVDVESLMNV